MKHVLVTGAQGGMGKATVQALSEQGYTVYALDLNPTSTAQNVIPVKVDVTNQESVKNAYEQVCKHTSQLDAVVHFAGIYSLDSLIEMDEEKFVKIFNVNLFGVYRINKAFATMLKKGGKIVITTSELAPLDPLPFTGIYAVTKSALDKYAYALRMEVQMLDVQVAVLRPGAVKTSLLNDSTKELDDFCDNTKLYKCNAKRFKSIVNKVEARNVSTIKIANKVCKILNKKRCKQVYNLNRNPLLLLLNALPKRWQTKIIKGVLKDK